MCAREMLLQEEATEQQTHHADRETLVISGFAVVSGAHLRSMFRCELKSPDNELQLLRRQNRRLVSNTHTLPRPPNQAGNFPFCPLSHKVDLSSVG